MTTEFEANITSLESIQEYIQNEPEVNDSFHITFGKIFHISLLIITIKKDDWIKEDSRPPKDWPNRGQIRFANFSAKYREELEDVLIDLSFSIRPGEKVGICGRTGAGKSTILLALFRMMEHTKGDIIIDDVNVKDIGLHDLRQKITIIPQVCFLIDFFS